MAKLVKKEAGVAKTVQAIKKLPSLNPFLCISSQFLTEMSNINSMGKD